MVELAMFQIRKTPLRIHAGPHAQVRRLQVRASKNRMRGFALSPCSARSNPHLTALWPTAGMAASAHSPHGGKRPAASRGPLSIRITYRLL